MKREGEEEHREAQQRAGDHVGGEVPAQEHPVEADQQPPPDDDRDAEAAQARATDEQDEQHDEERRRTPPWTRRARTGS